VAIIMDGNARWANERGVGVLEGHREGAQARKRTVKNADRLDVAALTAYAFSTENWSRPNEEVEGLMAMFAELIESETPELDEEGVRMRFIGRRERISATLLERMAWAEEVTAGNERMKLFVAFNYGGRAEILDAAARFEGGGRTSSAPAFTRPE
jgi:undecaprenyl diphosphate synthase